MIIIIIIVVVIVLIIWLFAGGFSLNSSPSAGGNDHCADCRRLDSWWNSQDGWGKLGGALWYGAQKFACALKGC